MSTEQDDSKTISKRKLHEKLLVVFREAKEDGLSWRDCYGVAEEANVEVFPEEVGVHREILEHLAREEEAP